MVRNSIIQRIYLLVLHKIGDDIKLSTNETCQLIADGPRSPQREASRPLNLTQSKRIG